MRAMLSTKSSSSQNSYPGGPLFNPLGLAKDIDSARDWKLKEIKNGLPLLLDLFRAYLYSSVISSLINHVLVGIQGGLLWLQCWVSLCKQLSLMLAPLIISLYTSQTRGTERWFRLSQGLLKFFWKLVPPASAIHLLRAVLAQEASRPNLGFQSLWEMDILADVDGNVLFITIILLFGCVSAVLCFLLVWTISSDLASPISQWSKKQRDHKDRKKTYGKNMSKISENKEFKGKM